MIHQSIRDNVVVFGERREREALPQGRLLQCHGKKAVEGKGSESRRKEVGVAQRRARADMRVSRIRKPWQGKRVGEELGRTPTIVN
jgi:hypothetical protein